MTPRPPFVVRLDLSDVGGRAFLAGIVTGMGGGLAGPGEGFDVLVTTPDRLEGDGAAGPAVLVWGAPSASEVRGCLRAGAADLIDPDGDSDQAASAIERALAVRASALRLQELEKRHRELATLAQLALDMGPELDVDRVLGGIVRQLNEALGYQVVSIMLLDEDGRHLSIRASRGLSEHVVQASRVDVGKGVAGTVVASGAPVLIEDLDRDPRFGSHHQSRFAGRSLVCVPLQVGERVIGALNASNSAGAPTLSAHDLDLLKSFAAQASLAIERARLHRELARQAEELREANRRLQAVDRVKSDFITNVSHEYRTPVTIVLGYMELLRGALVDPAQVERVDIAIRAAQRLSRLIDDSTDLLRLDTGTMAFAFSTVAVESLIEHAVQGFRPRFSARGVSLRVQAAAGLPQVQADLDKMRKALEKLLDNALKFTPRGGTVRLGAEPGAGGGVVLTVEDTGPGIPSEDRRRVFERFEQAGDIMTGKPEGTGLGLSIARAIVERHGGRIDLDPAFAGGCRLLVVLPAAGPLRG